MSRDGWPEWARLANAAGRALSVVHRERPAIVPRAYRAVALTLPPPWPRWLISELAASNLDRMARERRAEPCTALVHTTKETMK